MTELPPNHHADYRQFGGMFGYLAGLTMTIGRGSDARLALQLAELADGDRLLDIGCGPGTAVRIAARHGVDSTGVDPSRPMLNLARFLTRLRPPTSPVQWVQGGAEQLEVADSSISACWAIASVHHWPQLDPAVLEVRRVLRPGGLFVAMERLTKPGATGNSSHGWTEAQAQSFATMLTDTGFENTEISQPKAGRRQLIVVQGQAPIGVDGQAKTQ